MKTRVSLFPLLLAAALLLSGTRAAGRQEERGGQSLAAETPPAAAGKYFALLIGNNDYQHLPRLKTAESDAKAIAAALRDRYGFETRLLLNAGRRQIISALNEYRRKLEPDASLLIYYAGHGYRDQEVDKAYWLPADASKEETSNWISADDITTSVRGIPARHVLIISDSCYSGAIYRDLSPDLTTPPVRQVFLNKMAAGKSRTLMASGGDEPVSDAGGGAYSVFAGALLAGLTRMEVEVFTAAELFRSHVQESVAGRSRQTPEYSPLRNSGHEGGDFVFLRRREAAPAEAAAPARPRDPRVVPESRPTPDPKVGRDPLEDYVPEVERNVFNDGVSLFRQKQFRRAAVLFADFLRNFPNSGITDLTLLWLGRSYIMLKRLDDAEQIVRRLRSLTDTPFAPILGDELEAARRGIRVSSEPPAAKLPRKRITSLESDDAPGGATITITADTVLNDYSAFRSGDRFVVIIPRADADAQTRMSGMRGRGFEDGQTIREGANLLYSFKLARGASARASQRLNQVTVQFTVSAGERR
jgi:hypothetical protein